MKSKSFILLLGFFTVLALADASEPQKQIAIKHVHVDSVDRTNLTFTVKVDGTNLTAHFTAKTRFLLNGMPAVSKDLEPADHVSGTLRPSKDGSLEAVKIEIRKLAPK